jgi:subtilisin family serine protease
VESADVAAAEHATNVVSLIVGTGAGEAGSVGVKGVAPDASVIFYRVGRTGDIRCDDASGAEGHGASVGLAIDAAIDAGADIISLSLSFGPGAGVLEAVARGVGLGVIFVTALDNQDGPIGLPPWSSELNGGVGVQAIDSSVAVLTHEIGFEGERVPNTDPHVDVVAPGVGILFQGTAEAGWAGQRLASGTSLATPIVAGFLAVTAQKYPQATSNQLLQSLIHNTGAGDHELTYDPNQLLGYGVASLTQMLKVDPTTYPDVNPLFEPDGEPDAEEVAEALATPTPEPTDPGGGGVAGLVTPLIVVGAVLVVLVVAVLVIVLVVLGRRRRT